MDSLFVDRLDISMLSVGLPKSIISLAISLGATGGFESLYQFYLLWSFRQLLLLGFHPLWVLSCSYNILIMVTLVTLVT